MPRKYQKTPKFVFVIVALLVLGAAGFGYFRQASKLHDDEVVQHDPATIEVAALAPRPNDILFGDPNALVTIVEYSSLSCPHCAHFHQEVLPTLESEFITTGKVKLIMRHFPLNEPAMRGAQLVECAGKNGLKRENFLKVLFSMQKQWAFSEDFINSLKQIALVGGVDSATFDTCMNDKDSETSILAGRQEAETKLQVSATPYFFINGKKYEGTPSVDGFREAIKDASSKE